MPGLRDEAHILLIEDDPADALAIEEAFAQAGDGRRIHRVTDGAQAMAYLRTAVYQSAQPVPSLIILDLGLPAEHGLEFLADAKSDPEMRLIPVVILSSSRRPSDIRRSYGLHANAYILKPADFDGFTDVVKQIDACFLSVVYSSTA